VDAALEVVRAWFEVFNTHLGSRSQRGCNSIWGGTERAGRRINRRTLRRWDRA